MRVEFPVERSWRRAFKEHESARYEELRRQNWLAGHPLSDRKLRAHARLQATEHAQTAIRTAEDNGEEEPIWFVFADKEA